MGGLGGDEERSQAVPREAALFDYWGINARSLFTVSRQALIHTTADQIRCWEMKKKKKKKLHRVSAFFYM